ncbi:MAG: glucuronate isomerase [Oscillospiraceae bacterium]|nr:glucuronate isomerase [Oscillospiraceae bacterium]
MIEFLGKNFLLDNTSAQRLYHDIAAKTPIIDYHCHINAGEIFENKQFENIADAWLGGDHYKWRLMRAAGVSEHLITGDISGFDKFKAFAEVLPYCIGNPVYHWAHLELQRFFDIHTPLTKKTSEQIWKQTSEQLKNDETLRVRGIIERMKVEVIITTDDPVDDLADHIKLAADDSFKTKVLPGWRPDAALRIENDRFIEYLGKLADVSGNPIKDLDSLKSALKSRMEFFDKNGCKACDHGLLRLAYAPSPEEEVNSILQKRLDGESISTTEAEKYLYHMMCYLGREYARFGWVMELHVGVGRNMNSNMFDKLGADTGFDCIDPYPAVSGIGNLLDELNKTDELPKTLIFSINPSDNAAINTLSGCFQTQSIKGKVQQGSAWWFNDTYYGMKTQIESFAEGGVLGNFIGMLTDSRSFMSYTRHEYFRRILCNTLGGWVDSGKYPNDAFYLRNIVEDICYNNAKEFFGL